MNALKMTETIKKILITAVLMLSLLLFGYSLRAQSTPTIGFSPYGFSGMPDTVYSGSMNIVGAYIKNNSDSTVFADSLIITGYIDTGSARVHLPPTPIPNTTLGVNDSIFILIPVSFRDNYMGGLFRIGGNVIVVWPAVVGASSSFDTGDSLTATVVVLDTINGVGGPQTPGEMVRCYPVPARGLLYITSTSPSYHVKETTVYDAAGQLVAHSEQNNMGIDTSAWPPGIYILDVMFDNGTRRIYKISRE